MTGDAWARANHAAHAACGARARAARGWVDFPFTTLHDPLLAPLRDDGRFGEIAQWMRQQWQQFEV